MQFTTVVFCDRFAYLIIIIQELPPCIFKHTKLFNWMKLDNSSIDKSIHRMLVML